MKTENQTYDKIIFATSNQGKMDEIKMIMKDSRIPIVSLKEAGIEADIVEMEGHLRKMLLLRRKPLWS